MKLLVVGHLCKDVVHSRDGQERETWGGVANAVATLGALAGKDDTIVPICGVGPDDDGVFRAWLGRVPAVMTDGVFASGGPTNRIHIFEQDDGARTVCTREVAAPIPFERIRRFLAGDGLLISMASGADITLETLDQIRMEVRPRGTPIHLDLHNLTMGVAANGDRFRRPLPDWRRWAFMLTSVQMNEEEIAGLAIERLNEDQTVGHLLTLGVKGVIVTRGQRGATLYTSAHKEIVRNDIAPVPSSVPGSPTGLGDVFSAAYLFECVSSGDMVRAAAFAARIAGEAAERQAGVRSTNPMEDDRSAP
ncbi:MAG: carbohydrate kinase family protein [Bacteroidota bacterium]